MPRHPLVPEELTRGPFTVADALRAGLSRRQLRSNCWRQVGRGLYTWASLQDDPWIMLEATLRRLPPSAVLSGRTAGWLHGLDLAPCHPAEVTVPVDCGVSSRAGLSLRRSALREVDIVEVRGLPCTSPMRTLFDLSRYLPLTDAVVAVDMALRLSLIELNRFREYVAARPRAAGCAQARRVGELAEPRTESPMESRLRVLLVLAELPRPCAQVEVNDDRGRFIGRLDLYYPAQRLGLEYDGDTHRDRLVPDNRRQNRLLAAGYRLLRFTAADVYNRPDSVVAQVRAALAA